MPRIPIAAALAVLGVAGAAHAADGGLKAAGARVNICDPASGSVGVRATIPGDGRSGRMRVRFRAQWFNHQEKGWLAVRGAGTSPWLDAGSARDTYGEIGWTFLFERKPGARHLVRAVAELQWTDAGRVRRSTQRVTRSRGSCLLE